jgi:hypothetical protein
MQRGVLKIMHGESCACMHQALWIRVRQGHLHLGIIPAEGGWTDANDSRILYVPALICNVQTGLGSLERLEHLLIISHIQVPSVAQLERY